jgi:hypothetical protein
VAASLVSIHAIARSEYDPGGRPRFELRVTE